MHRPDTPNRQVNKHGAGKDGFRDGNKALGVDATEFDAAMMDDLWENICQFIESRGIALVKGNFGQLAAAIDDAINDAAGGFNAFSITALPTTNIGPIYVIEAQEMWTWSASAYFNGYRSLLCGAPTHGHTANPLPYEIDAVGGTISKTSYARLWGYAQENGLVVASGSWVAGSHNFVDLGGDNFRVPDLRNVFFRRTGTDADTANAIALGARQADAFQGHWHRQRWVNTGQAGGSGYLMEVSQSSNISDAGGVSIPVSDGTNGTPRTSKETRPLNTAYKPRIHV